MWLPQTTAASRRTRLLRNEPELICGTFGCNGQSVRKLGGLLKNDKWVRFSRMECCFPKAGDTRMSCERIMQEEERRLFVRAVAR